MKRAFLLGPAILLLTDCSGSSQQRAPTFAYVGNNGADSVSVFRVDPGTGMLTLVDTVKTAAGGATYCEFHPSGKFMFVSGQFSNAPLPPRTPATPSRPMRSCACGSVSR